MPTPAWRSWKVGALVLILAAAVAGGVYWWSQAGAPEVSYRTARIERGPLQATVSASGTVNPVTQVSVGTQVSGQIKELLVDFNSEVRAGQLIALIDPETFEYRVRQAQADVEAAQAAVLTAQANAAAVRAAVSRARVDLTEAQRDLERKRMLVERQFIAQSEADRAQALVNTSTEAVRAAEAQEGVAQAQVKSAQANVAQRQAGLAQAQVDLARTRIVSPVSGIVIKRAIEKGQTVAASLQSPELFIIARNLQDMQVEASIDESDISRIRTGQAATFTVDAYPGQSFEGEIRQVRKAAQTTANVVTYVAVIGFSNPGGRLMPGMTANVRVVTEARESVLKVPNAALRVRIAGVEPAARGTSGPAPAGSAAPAASGAVSAPTTTSRPWGLPWISEAQAQDAPGRPGAGPGALRERLVRELELSPEQQTRLDAVLGEMRPRFAALRDLPEAERAAARDRLSAQMRDRIAALLTPPQKARYAQMNAAASAAGGGSGGPAAAAGPGGSAPSAAGPGGPRGPGAVAGPGGGGGASEFRQRLVTELKLTPAQVEKVDAIYADMRPRFLQLRDLPAEERPKARERLMADIRARIGDQLTPEQKPRYAAMLAEAATRAVTRGRIYVLGEDGKPRAFNVRLGITDGTMTELIVAPGSPEETALREGTAVITGVIGAGAAAPTPERRAGPRLSF